nr:RecName: Full=Heterotroph-specific protein [Thiomonas delicata]
AADDVTVVIGSAAPMSGPQ